MKQSAIQVGKTYVNRGAGRTRRTVIEISDRVRPERWLGAWGSPPPNEPGVRYRQEGTEASLHLSSFANWAGGEAP